MQVEKGRLAGWLVAPKIARINIRARHCHSVNFPRCWLYRVRKEERGFARGVAERGGGRREKHRYPFPHPPRWNFMRSAFSMPLPRTCGPRPHFRCALPSTPYALLRRYRSANTDRKIHTRIACCGAACECTRVREWKKKRGGKITANNVGLVNELSRQKLQLLRSEPRKWIGR